MQEAYVSQPLRIAQVAPLWTSVPPSAYGGAELMVHWLTEELVHRGHEVTLFASGDSRTMATLRASYPCNLIEAMTQSAAYQYEHYANSQWAEVLRESHAFDVIHCHVGATMIPFSVLSSTPVLHTIHAGLASVDEAWLLAKYPAVPIVAISHSQIATIPAERRQHIRVIYHGCDFDAYEASFTPGKYLAFIGRMGPHKNPLAAIRIANALEMPIVLAGQPQDQSEQIYFNEQVKPLIDGTRVTYLGSIDHARKVEFLKNASVLLVPIQWDEHFGLVMIEAMACGTPVVASHRGSVSEVVDVGKTGFYTDSVEELTSLVPRALSLDRRAIHQHALQRFSHQRMVDEYLDVYEAMANADAG